MSLKELTPFVNRERELLLIVDAFDEPYRRTNPTPETRNNRQKLTMTVVVVSESTDNSSSNSAEGDGGEDDDGGGGDDDDDCNSPKGALPPWEIIVTLNLKNSLATLFKVLIIIIFLTPLVVKITITGRNNGYDYRKNQNRRSDSVGEDVVSLRRQLVQRLKNLSYLEEQAAMYSAGQIPLDLHNQIEKEKEAIEVLKDRIKAWGK